MSYFEKFGFDGPAGLFFDHEQTQIIRALFSNTEFMEPLDEVIRGDADLQAENAGVENLPDLSPDDIAKTLNRFIESLKNPVQLQRVKSALADERFRQFPTVRWSIVMNMQRSFLRDACLATIAERLDHIRTDIPVVEQN